MAITKKWAANGIKTPIPTDPQGDNLVNYDEGFTTPYRTPIKDGGVPIGMGIFNQLMFDITDETDSSTLNGWVMEHLGRIPDVGDKFNAHGLEITIKAADGRRVNEINVVHTPVKPEKGTK